MTVRNVLLILPVALLYPAILSSCSISPPAAPVTFRPIPKVDERGFIDVWQLRSDVAAVEPFQASDDTDHCYLEGDPEEEPLSQENMQKFALEEQTCVEKAQRAFATYERLRAEFNRAWLPVTIAAVNKGDRVAEVILRQCDTTPLFDRTNIESTCDEEPRRGVAIRRLQEIGFVPATELSAQMVPLYPTKSPNERNEREVNQRIVLHAIQHGVLGLDKALTGAGDTDQHWRARLIEALVQDAPRAFTFTPGPFEAGWATSQFASLRLNRKPLTPGYLTWGRALHFGGGNGLWTGPRYWRSHDYSRRLGWDRVIADKGIGEFERALRANLAALESNIDRYLKDDPRWAVFLINRIGHHEWVPEGMKSTTHQLDPAWLGEWVLEKETRDWATGMVAAKGVAIIRRDGEFTKMTVKSRQNEIPLGDVSDCVLRYSGGLTFLPEITESGQTATATVLGYFPPGRFDDGAISEAVAPFDPRKRYKQVLMQCPGAEWEDTDRIRFLMLANDTLLELGASEPSEGRFVMRHYRRATPTHKSEHFPFDGSTDFDGDWIGDNADPDDDNDGIPDISDIAPYNDVPTPAILNVLAYPGASVNGMLRATDTEWDQVIFDLVTPPTQGTVILTNPATGAFTYTARADARGNDAFAFRVRDLGGASAPQRVFLSLRMRGNRVVAAGYSGSETMTSERLQTTKGNGWSGIVDIAASQGHTVGLKADGTVVAVGDNDLGQTDVRDWWDIVDVAAGLSHTVGLKADGTVLATGRGNHFRADVNDWRDVVAVTAGYFTTLGLKADGTVLVSESRYSPLGSEIGRWRGIVAVAAGEDHVVGLKADGTVVVAEPKATHQAVGHWKNVVAVAAGDGHTVGLKDDGTVVATGLNDEGQTSVGGWRNVVAVAAGRRHTLGLRADGTVLAVGHIHEGVTEVRGWSGILAISAGTYHSVGIMAGEGGP